MPQLVGDQTMRFVDGISGACPCLITGRACVHMLRTRAAAKSWGCDIGSAGAKYTAIVPKKDGGANKAQAKKSREMVMAMTAQVSSRATASEATRWGQLVFGIICMVMIANLQYGWT